MEQCWLHRKSKKNLLVFCAGWGMDAQPFKHLKTSCYDVLFLYNFNSNTKNFNLITDLAGYEQTSLVAWSMGVWWGRQLFGRTQCFDRTVAVNGTLCPIDAKFGIARDLMNTTLERWSESTREKFYRRMCRDPKVLEAFLRAMPQRTIVSQQQELAYYLETITGFPKNDNFYTDIVISQKDFVIPTKNQCHFWADRTIKNLSGGHFPFFSWQSWDEMLAVIAGEEHES